MLRHLLLAATAAVALTGCPGSIDDPTPFYAAEGSRCPSDFDVEVDLLTNTCGRLGCHQGADNAAAGLDLRSEGVRERILAHTSTQCDDLPLIDPGDFENSYILRKVGHAPPCGQRMPAGDPPLTGTQRACLEQYLADLAGVERTDAAVPRSDGGPAPDIDGGSPPTDSGAEPLPAVTYEAESDLTLTGYVVDTADTNVIRLPAGVLGGAGAVTFDGAPGTYTLTVHVVTEPDGEPTLRVFVDGAMVSEATYPFASGTEHEAHALPSVEVTLAVGDEIRIEGEADAEGTLPDGVSSRDAWARVDRLELAP